MKVAAQGKAEEQGQDTAQTGVPREAGEQVYDSLLCLQQRGRRRGSLWGCGPMSTHSFSSILYLTLSSQNPNVKICGWKGTTRKEGRPVGMEAVYVKKDDVDKHSHVHPF